MLKSAGTNLSEKMKKWGRNKGASPTLFPILLLSCDEFVTRMCKHFADRVFY